MNARFFNAPMQRRSAPLVVLGACAFLMSCSLVVEIELPQEGSDDDCASLDRSRPVGVNDCVKWQFNSATLQCELVPLDRDDDGFFDAVCIGDPVAGIEEGDEDCDDDGASSFPGAPELCDEQDNDCDARVDEGVLQTRPSDGPIVTLTGTLADIHYASDVVSANTVGIAYTLPNNTPGTVTRDRSVTSASETGDRFRLFSAAAANGDAAEAAADSIRSAGSAIAPIANNQYAVAFVNPSMPRRVIAGVATNERDKQLFVDTAVLSAGLPCAPSEGDCTLARRLIDSPVLGVSGSDVLVTSTRRLLVDNECADAVEDVPVIGNALRKRDLTRVSLPSGGEITFPVLRLSEVTPEGFDIGSVRSDATPAVIGLPSAGFVVALPLSDNSIALRRVTVTDGAFSVAPESADQVVTVDDVALHDPAFALSAPLDHDNDDQTDPIRTLALAFRAGCGGTGLIYVQLYNLNAVGNLSRRGNPVKVDGKGLTSATSEARPAITFSSEHDNTWFVSYIKQDSAHARVLGTNGALYGSESYKLIDAADRIGQTPGVFSVAEGAFDGASYGAMIDATLDGGNGIHAFHLGCFAADD